MADEPENSREDDGSATSTGIWAEKALQRFREMDDEEFEQRIQETDDDQLPEMLSNGELSREDAIQFLSGFLGFTERKREVQAELRDVTDFDDDEWEDGFEYFRNIPTEEELKPRCLECRDPLTPGTDEIRVAADGAVTQTFCTSCGETSLQDRRSFHQLARESAPPIPDSDEVEVRIDDDLRDQLGGNTDDD